MSASSNATHTFSLAYLYITITKKISNMKVYTGHKSFLLAYSKELSKWRRMAFIFLWKHSWLPRFWFTQIRGFVMSMWRQNNVKSQKMPYLWRRFLYGTERFCTVVTLIIKFHAVSIVTSSWHQNGLQFFSIQRVKSEFPPSRIIIVICSCCSFNGCE